VDKIVTSNPWGRLFRSEGRQPEKSYKIKVKGKDQKRKKEKRRKRGEKK
jgi:hypothetical protein